MKSPPKYYEVGYKKPPKKNQFVKGQSGNPSGKPKEATTLKTMPELLAAELQKSVVVTEGGKSKSMTKAEVLAAHVINSAIAGNNKAILKSVIGLLMNLPAPPGEGKIYRVTPEGEKLVEEFLNKVEKYKTLEDDERN